jgi:hypothetical protein
MGLATAESSCGVDVNGLLQSIPDADTAVLPDEPDAVIEAAPDAASDDVVLEAVALNEDGVASDRDEYDQASDAQVDAAIGTDAADERSADAMDAADAGEAQPTDADDAADESDSAMADASDGSDASDATGALASDAADGATDASDGSDASDATGALASVAADGATDGGPPLVARLSIGGPTYVGVDYPGDWQASPVPGTCGPYSYTTNAPIHGTRDAPLFRGEAYGIPVNCNIGSRLPIGTYRVRLYFAETWWGAGCPGGGGVGARVFDIVIEGRVVLAGFDILAASGGCICSTTTTSGVPVVKTFDVFVGDGTLDIALVPTKDKGKISGIEVFGPL